MKFEPFSQPFSVDVRDADAFMHELKERLERTSPDDSAVVGVLRSEIRGRASAEGIFMELVTIPLRSRRFQFAPVFQGRLSDDRRRLVGRFRPLNVSLLMPVIFLAWIAGAFIPAVVNLAKAGFPQGRVVDELIPVSAGLLIGTGIWFFARRQSARNRREMESLLRNAAR